MISMKTTDPHGQVGKLRLTFSLTENLDINVQSLLYAYDIVIICNCAPVCILPHGFGSCLGSLKHYLSGVACRAVSGIDVSVKPVCLRL